MSFTEEIIRGVIIILISSGIIWLTSLLVKSKRLLKWLKIVFKFFRSITKEHILGSLTFLGGIFFILMAIIVTEPSENLNYATTNILGTTISCNDNYKCFWDIERDQNIYIPIKVKPNRIISLDIRYETDINSKIIYDFGNIKNIPIDVKNTENGVNILNAMNSKELYEFKNNTVSRILNFLDIANTNTIWLRINPNENIKIFNIIYDHKALTRTQNITIAIVGLIYLIGGAIIILIISKSKKKRKSRK